MADNPGACAVCSCYGIAPEGPNDSLGKKRLASELRIIAKMWDEKEDDLARLNRENADLRRALARAEADAASEKTMREARDDRIKALTSNLDKCQEQVKLLIDEKEKALKQNDQDRETIADLTRQLKERDDLIRKLQKALEEERDARQREQERNDAEIAKLRDEIKRLDDERRRQEETRTEREEELHRVNAELDELRAKYDQAMGDISDLQRKVVQLSAALQERDDELSRLRADFAEASRRLQEANHLAEQLTAENAALKTRLKDLEAENGRLRDDLKNYKSSEARESLIRAAQERLASLKPWVGLEIPVHSLVGVKVLDVRPRSPAQQAGVQTGDQIEKFNNEEVTNTSDFKLHFARIRPGDKMHLRLNRRGQILDSVVEVSCRRASADEVAVLRRIASGSLQNGDESFMHRVNDLIKSPRRSLSEVPHIDDGGEGF